MNVALTYNVKPDLPLRAFTSASPFPSLDTFPGADVGASLPEEMVERYAEWDEPETVEAIRAALARVADVTMVEADAEAFGILRDLRPDIVFNVAEGLDGVSRESFIPAACEFLGIPYTGSDALTLALCLEKSRAKEILAYRGIPTARFDVVASTEELTERPIDLRGGRKFVKPVREGSGKGIYNSSIVSTSGELEREVRRVLNDFDQPALVEDYLEGREFTVALLGNGAELRVLPIIEMTFEGLPAEARPIYGYESKWVYDLPDRPVEECYKCPAPLSAELKARLEGICRDAFRALDCRDWARIDLRCDAAEHPFIIELNPLPGMIPDPNAHSSFPMAARAAGLDYAAVIHAVLDAALERYGLPRLVPAPGRGGWRER